MRLSTVFASMKVSETSLTIDFQTLPQFEQNMRNLDAWVPLSKSDDRVPQNVLSWKLDTVAWMIIGKEFWVDCMQEFPFVRYCAAKPPAANPAATITAPDLVSTKLAAALWDRLMKYKSTLIGFPQFETCELVIVGRSIDPVSPCCFIKHPAESNSSLESVIARSHIASQYRGTFISSWAWEGTPAIHVC